MPDYYCNVLLRQLGSENGEIADPDWSDVRGAFDALRARGAGNLTLGRLSRGGRENAGWVAPILQLRLEPEREQSWQLRGFGRDAECEAAFSNDTNAFNALLRAFNSETAPELAARDGWIRVREHPGGPRRAGPR